MKVIGFKPEEIQTVYKILATILHLVSRDTSQHLLPPCGDRMLFVVLDFFLTDLKSNSCRKIFSCFEEITVSVVLPVIVSH